MKVGSSSLTILSCTQAPDLATTFGMRIRRTLTTVQQLSQAVLQFGITHHIWLGDQHHLIGIKLGTPLDRIAYTINEIVQMHERLAMAGVPWEEIAPQLFFASQ